LRPALPPHDLIAHATVLKPGRRIVYGEVHVYSGDKLVAHATLSFLNTDAGQAGKVDNEGAA
jgi:acyl-coenzyme A thioesterase PaaI-like protein